MVATGARKIIHGSETDLYLHVISCSIHMCIGYIHWHAVYLCLFPSAAVQLIRAVRAGKLQYIFALCTSTESHSTELPCADIDMLMPSAPHCYPCSWLIGHAKHIASSLLRNWGILFVVSYGSGIVSSMHVRFEKTISCVLDSVYSLQLLELSSVLASNSNVVQSVVTNSTPPPARTGGCSGV